jgi:microsomal dipeptidase-like Zn-dependent dipeptidase
MRRALRDSQAFDVRACSAKAGRVATTFELDAPELLASDPTAIPLWVERGVSVFSLAGSRDSSLATSAFPSGPERSVGLSQVGRDVVRRALQAGALVDVASLSDLAVQDVLELADEARAPVVATRGSARAVHSRPGSFSNAQLRAIARSGGVVGLSFDRDLLGDGGPIQLSDVLQQVTHLLHIAGPSAVALASGFEEGARPPDGLSSAARYPRLAEALRATGMGESELRQLFRDNAWRVLCARSQTPLEKRVP